VSMDLALLLAGIGMEAAVVLLLLHRHLLRTLPMFCLYVLWTLVSDIAGLAFSHLVHDPARYLQFFLIEMPVDSLLQFGVLVELAWSALRPFRPSLPRGAIFGVMALVVVIGVAVWPFSSIAGVAGLPPQWHLLARLQQTFSILRVLLFLTLAGFSQLLAIGWRNRELQIATGLGFYSLASLAASVIHTHQSMRPYYHRIDQVLILSYFCSLLYWTVSFAQKEAPRQELSPKMQSFLVTLASAARTTRIAVGDSAAGSAPKPPKP
jgi:hypothetical protein